MTSITKENTVEQVMTAEQEKLLECPVCLEQLSAPVHQCFRGHNFCGRCYKRLSDKDSPCPLCHGVFVGTRNYLVEQLLDQLPRMLQNKNSVENGSSQVQSAGALPKLSIHLQNEENEDGYDGDGGESDNEAGSGADDDWGHGMDLDDDGIETISDASSDADPFIEDIQFVSDSDCGYEVDDEDYNDDDLDLGMSETEVDDQPIPESDTDVAAGSEALDLSQNTFVQEQTIRDQSYISVDVDYEVDVNSEDEYMDFQQPTDERSEEVLNQQDNFEPDDSVIYEDDAEQETHGVEVADIDHYNETEDAEQVNDYDEEGEEALEQDPMPEDELHAEFSGDDYEDSGLEATNTDSDEDEHNCVGDYESDDEV